MSTDPGTEYPNGATDDLPYLPVGVEGLFDPPLELARWRNETPLHRIRMAGPESHPGWVVLGHRVAREVLGDPRFEKVFTRDGGIVLPAAGPQAHRGRSGAGEDDAARERHGTHEGDRCLAAAVSELDELSRSGDPIFWNAPEHTRLRGQLAKFFSVRRIRELRPDVNAIVSSVAARVEEEGDPIDWVESVAVRVPLQTICRFVGLTDPSALLANTQDLFATETSGFTVTAEQLERLFVEAESAVRRASSSSDNLIGNLLRESNLTEREIVGVAMAIAQTGFHTTVHLLASAFFALLADRSRWVRLCNEPSLILPAIEELMRFLTISRQSAHVRRAVEDVEVAGVQIKKGDWVHVSLPAANRDPERFPNPDELDLDRDASGHVLFGFGARQCLGQNLVRVELDVLLNEMTRRFPTLRLAVPPDEVPLSKGAHILFAPRTLMVSW